MSDGRLFPDLDTRRSPRHVDLAEIPGFDPFSVWDCTIPEADRYNASIRRSLGDYRGETTRENSATYVNGVGPRTKWTGRVSLFSPFLARAVVRSYSQPGDTVFDPFASIVRPYVTLAEGREYIGCEIRPEEIERIRATTDNRARIFAGDCRLFTRRACADLVFTCPPYWQQERYSDDPRDLSTLARYDDFLAAMAEVARVSFAALRGAYCVLVLGDFRVYGQGQAIAQRLVPFTADVTAVYEAAGFERYDQITVIKVAAGFARGLVKSWTNRKTVRVHETLVVLRRVFDSPETP